MKLKKSIGRSILLSIGLMYIATGCNPPPATYDICIELSKETAYCTSIYNWPTAFVASGESEMNIQTIANTADETWWGQTYTSLTMYGMNSNNGKIDQIPIVQNASFSLIVEFDENSCVPPSSGCWTWYYESVYPAVEDPLPCSLSSNHSINFAANQPMIGGCI
jgi:hypothetical protein|tara:strand:- start:1236 stop:1727 length:492 start_codon:yes stop_codon:yes gene_type:complete